MRRAPANYGHATSDGITDDGIGGRGKGLRSLLRQCGVLDRDDTGRTPIASQFPIVLWGPPGTGKTCSAAVVYRQWPSPVEENGEAGAFWCRLEDFVTGVMKCRTSREKKVAMRASNGQWVHRDESMLWKMAGRDDLWVIDDLGLRDVSAATYEIVFRLIDMRQRRPTIITSNLSPQQLRDLYDDRIASRLSSGLVVEVTGEDQRTAQGKQIQI